VPISPTANQVLIVPVHLTNASSSAWCLPDCVPDCATACLVRQSAAKLLTHTADCSGLVRQVLDETVLSATVAADAKSPHWLILTSTKVVQVAMDLVQPAHSVAVTAQSPTASRRPAVSQALSHLTGRPLHMHGPICPFMPFSTGPSNLSLMHWCIHACMHATFMHSCMHQVSFPQVRCVQCYIALCVCSNPQLHVATSGSHCICLASCAIAC